MAPVIASRSGACAPAVDAQQAATAAIPVKRIKPSRAAPPMNLPLGGYRVLYRRNMAGAAPGARRQAIKCAECAVHVALVDKANHGGDLGGRRGSTGQ